MIKPFLSLIFLPLIICGCSNLEKTPQNATMIPTINISNPPSETITDCKLGCGGSSDSNSLLNYKTSVGNIIYNNWNVPPNSEDKKAWVEFDLSENGYISNITIVTNDNVFKNSLKNALEKSNPLPVPPSSQYDKLKHLKTFFLAK